MGERGKKSGLFLSLPFGRFTPCLEEIAETSRMPSFFMACLFQCFDYIDHPKPMARPNALDLRSETGSRNSTRRNKVIRLRRGERKNARDFHREEKGLNPEDAAFDCEIVRGTGLRRDDEKLVRSATGI